MAYGDRRPFITPRGYVRLYRPEHPLANRWGHVLEHRMVAWDCGLLTDPAQHVHHVNGDRADNRPENLWGMVASDHASHHASQQVKRTRDEYLAAERERKRRQRPLRTCEVCGREFGWDGRADGRGCSNKCRAVLRRRDGWRPNYRRTCEVCGREFRTRAGDGRACSPTCRSKLRAAYGADSCTTGMP